MAARCALGVSLFVDGDAATADVGDLQGVAGGGIRGAGAHSETI